MTTADRRHTTRHSRHTVLLLPACLALLTHVACFNAGIPIRPADLPPGNQLAGSVQAPIITYAGGQVTTSDGYESHGNSGQRALIHPMAALFIPMLNASAGLAVGLSDWSAFGLSIGFQQLGGELRFELLDEDDGNSASLALTVGSAYRPFIEAELPWSMLGFDLSRRAASTVAFANVYASFGPENHAMGLDENQNRECGGFGEEGCGEYGPPRHFVITRDELRLHLALGLGPWSRDTNYDTDQAFTVSIVGYWTAWAGEPDRLDCIGCSYLEPVALTEHFGASLVLGFTIGALDEPDGK